MAQILAAFLLILSVYLVRYYLKWFHRYRKFPGPSPWLSLPVFGHSWIVAADPVHKMQEMRAKYGDIFRLDMGFLPTVFLTNYEDIVECFNLPALAGRGVAMKTHAEMVWGRRRDGNAHGVIASEGKMWSEQRKFMVQALTKLGMNSKEDSVMVPTIVGETHNLCSILERRSKQEGAIPVKDIFTPLSCSIVWYMVTGKAIKQDSPEMLSLTEHVTLYFQSMSPSRPIRVVSLYSRLLNKLVAKFAIDTVKEESVKVKQIVGKEIDAASPDVEGNFMERFKAEIRKAVDNPGSSFHRETGENNLMAQMMDALTAGVDTAAVYLEFATLYLVAYPESQEKLAQEIESVLGGTPPTLADRDRMPYTMAFLSETSRVMPMGVFPPSRRTLEEVTLRNGVVIPKHTQVYSSFAAVHMNPNNFDEPEEFRPERFIDKDTGSFNRDDRVITFGIGKRKCPGQILARAESFLILATLVQNFRLEAASQLDFDVVSGLSLAPKPFDVNFILRKDPPE